MGSTVHGYEPEAGQEGKAYFIVGSPEADPSKGKISNLSPIGKALLGTKVGQVARAQVPAGTINLEVLDIQ